MRKTNYSEKVDQIVIEMEQLHKRVKNNETGDGNGHPSLDKFIISALKWELAVALETIDNSFEILNRK